MHQIPLTPATGTRNGMSPRFRQRPRFLQAMRALGMAETTGRPVADAAWVEALERASGRTWAPQKRGPKVRAEKL